LGSPARPTAKGAQFESAVRELTGGARPFFEEGFGDHIPQNFALLLTDPDRHGVPVSAGTNVSVVYDIDPGLGVTADQLNSGVRRLPANPDSRDATRHPDAVPTTGKISKPFLTLHDTGDLFVPITQEISYRKKADAAGSGDLLVQRLIRYGGHCRFSPAELTTAWQDL